MRSLRLSLVASLFLVPVALGGCATHVVTTAQPADIRLDTVTVVGKGEARHAPDVAQATLGFETTAATVAEATQRANAQMNAIIDAVKKAGIADKDIQTSSLNIGFERNYPPYPPPPVPLPEPAPPPTKPGKPGMKPQQAPKVPANEPTHAPASPPTTSGPVGWYRVSNQVTVTVRDIGKIGPVLDAAMGAGANSVQQLSFRVDDPKPLEAEARAKAFADAKAQAEQLAQLAGRKLGEVIVVSEQVSGGIRPFAAPMAMNMARAESMPIEAGEVTVTEQLELMYRFAPK